MKKLIAVIVMFSLECAAWGQVPTDTSRQVRPIQKDTARRDVTKPRAGAVLDTARPIDTINRKIEQMRPKSKDDLKDTVPQNKQ